MLRPFLLDDGFRVLGNLFWAFEIKSYVQSSSYSQSFME